MRSRILLLLAVLLPATSLMAQEEEPGGIWTGITIEKNITKKWSVDTEIEFRSNGFSPSRDRFGIQFGTDYEIFKNFKLGASYNWMNVNDDYKYNNAGVIRTDYFQNRHRINAQAVYRYDIGDFRLQLRERFRVTYKDDSDRIMEDGTINTNRLNPDYVWRNRLKISYNKKKLDWTPYVSFETYYLLNDPEEIRFYNAEGSDYKVGNSYISRLRSIAGIAYKINKRNSIEVYGLYTNNRGPERIRVDGPNYNALTEWSGDFVVGIGYTLGL